MHFHPTMPYWPLIAFLHGLIFIPTAIHILLNKDDERAAISWLGLVALSPFLGSALYWIFGINRVRRRARKEMREEAKDRLFSDCTPGPDGDLSPGMKALMRMGLAIHNADYLPGNGIRLLVNGDEAYPAMIEAIDSAQHDIVLCSYIFDYDRAGKKFVEALGRARARGVAVYVLLDGAFYAWRWRMTRHALKKRGIVTAHYLSSPRFINLRNHRKILSIDGRLAFIGGINIRQGNVLKDKPRSPVQDIHFEVTGPVIDQINQIFAADWQFATGKSPPLSAWEGTAEGSTIARALPDGPDWNYQKLEWAILGAIDCATRNIRIITPYFIPDVVLIRALEAASLRGVTVEIIVPERSNIPFLDWAMQAGFGKLLEYGVKLYQCPRPFNHAKLFLVDDMWACIGSGNWDERSLVLNFEINLECYDADLNARLREFFDAKKAGARTLSKQDNDCISVWRALRNNLFRLFSPYL